jgi:hypothetical protein
MPDVVARWHRPDFGLPVGQRFVEPADRRQSHGECLPVEGTCSATLDERES